MKENRAPVRFSKRPRPVLVALSLLVSMLPAWGDPVQAAAPPPSLAGKTVVAGTSTAGMRVHVPRPVTIDVASGVRIEGGGRLAGVVLTRENVGEHGRESLEAVRFGYCDGVGCRPGDTSERYVYARSSSGGHGGGALSLGAGEYLLYLMADGNPARVTLLLEGLGGSTVLQPEAPVESGFAVPTAENSTGTPGDDSFWWGDEFDVDGDAGYVFGVLRIEVEKWLDVHYGDCAYVADPPPPRPLAYSPPCPGGISVFANESSDLPASREFEVPTFVEINGGGRFGYGMHYTGAADVTSRFSLFFHMSLDPDTL